MSKQTKKPLQIRISPDTEREAALIEKLQKIADENGVSVTLVANTAMAAGIIAAEDRIKRMHDPELPKAA